jgi:predicted nucleic acid-binding Zn ribbon protein
METGSKVRENLALGFWDKVVGPQAAAATEPESVREGVLFVRTKSSVWSHELTFLKGTIIQRLNQRIGRPVIREIIFRAQGVKRPPAPTPLPKPTPEELAAVVLSPEDQRKLDSELRRIARIPEERIRESVRKRVVRESRLNRWRLEHGWNPCARCQAVHPLEDDLCPLCRIVQ